MPLPKSKIDRLEHVLDLALDILIGKICSGRISINKEASMQLHYASIINDLGNLLSIEKDEYFAIELEHEYNQTRRMIDIQCGFNDVKAAIELKCFRKNARRAIDTDMYAVIKDVERLGSYNDFAIRKFVCLTDDEKYVNGPHNGHAAAVSIKQGRTIKANSTISPTWQGQWKNKNNDSPLFIKSEVKFSWKKNKDWYLLNINV